MSQSNSTSNPVSTARAIGQGLWLERHPLDLLDDALASDIREEQVIGLIPHIDPAGQTLVQSGALDESISAVLTNARQMSTAELYRRLAMKQVQIAADALVDIHRQSEGIDGLAGMLISPEFEQDAASMLADAVDLHKHIDRQNLIFSVPGTREGIKAFEAMTALGINVNLTHVSSISGYRQAAHAYLRGLERRLADDMPIDHLSSVVGFTLARVDSVVDAQLQQLGGEDALALCGRIATANARVAYGHFVNLFGSEAFGRLRQAGARPLRLRWTDTTVSNAELADVHYAQELIAPDTVLSLRSETLQAFMDHGVAEARLTPRLAAAHAEFSALHVLGISLNDIIDELQQSHMAACAQAHSSLLDTLDERRQQVIN